MDRTFVDETERNKSIVSPATSYINGSMRRPCTLGGGATVAPTGSPVPNMGPQVLRVVVNPDERGYGMKVSGDKPVFVQSVKEGGAAAKAGLHADDKIIQVNGVDVMDSTHEEVVGLIRASTQVVLTVQQKPRMMGSPSLHVRQMHAIPLASSSTRITGPKPADNEKQRQFAAERVQTLRLMLEEEQRYVDTLRSDLARCPADYKKLTELNNAEKNVATLQSQLQALLHNNEPIVDSLACATGTQTLPNKTTSSHYENTRLPHSHSVTFGQSESPPPLLPKRSNIPKNNLTENVSQKRNTSKHCPLKSAKPQIPKHDSPDSPSRSNISKHSSLESPVNSNSPKVNPLDLATNSPPNHNHLDNFVKNNFVQNAPPIVRRPNLKHATNAFVANERDRSSCAGPSAVPPPLPPRVPHFIETEAVNSINKQMTYPLVATCATLCNHYDPSTAGGMPTHQRTKSSPDPLGSSVSTAEAARKLVTSESLSDLSSSRVSASDSSWDLMVTPPGTPPPPYPSPPVKKRDLKSNRNSVNTEDGDSFQEESINETTPETSPLRPSNVSIATSSPIVAASTNTVQKPIISMEDDEISDQETLEDHGPFKSLSRLWEHTTHLAVFMNYVICNSDPSSLLFYLLTDLYKEGNAKDMRKWAYEIHSSFLVPGAPLRLSNVDESIAREIDDVLLREGDKEEILRKIFWKARNRAKEELNEQLAEFQQKRIEGMGIAFGPPDNILEEISHDKAKELKLYESLLLPKLEPYLEEMDKEPLEPRRFITAVALATVIVKVFGVRGAHVSVVDRCPMFVSKDKSFKSKILGRYSRKLNVLGHQYVALHYFSVISCNNCHQIMYGIGPQGYQCSACLINLHRHCVKQYEDTCPGPMTKKDRGIGKFMDRIRADSKESRRKPSAYFISMERDRRLNEERDSVPENDHFMGDRPPGQPVSRSSSDKRPEAVFEEATRGHVDTSGNHHDRENFDNHHENLQNVQRAKSSQPAINRSESYKEQSQKRRQIRERRKISDPNLSKSHDLDSDHQELSYHSGSSSSSSLSSRSSESPHSTNLDAVPGSGHHPLPHSHHHQHSHHSSFLSSTSSSSTSPAVTSGVLSSTTAWDSDVDIEPDPPDWQSSVSEDILSRLHPEEKKRQEIINELFHTERSHVRNLKVLETVFYRPMLQNKNLPSDKVYLLFPNLEQMLEIHETFNQRMKQRRKEQPLIIGEIGEILLDMFEGHAGETLKEAAAKFCARQQVALKWLREKRRKDPKINSFLLECESDKLCKRLQLKDIIPTGMQRLVKYPLLFESLSKCTERVIESTLIDSIPNASSPSSTTEQQMGPTQQELMRLKRALERSKEILNYVNEAVKEAEDAARLEDIQKRLDKTGVDKAVKNFNDLKNLDLTQHKLVHEGPLIWRINKQNKVAVHVVLLEDIIVLLQKQDEKFLLKTHTSNVVHSPVFKISTVLVRRNASEKESLYLINTAQTATQIYYLTAQSPMESEGWFKHISDAAEAYKSREGKSRRSEFSTPEPEPEPEPEANFSGNETHTDTDPSSSADNSARNSGVLDDEKLTSSAQDEQTTVPTTTVPPSQNNSDVNIGGGVVKREREAQIRLAGSGDDELPLIQSSDVEVQVLPVYSAQTIVTLIEQVRHKDETIRQALKEKESLVAEMLRMPASDYTTIAEMACESATKNKDPTELILAAIHQSNTLTTLISDALNVSEANPILASSYCASNSFMAYSPNVCCTKLQGVSSALNTHLTALLDVIKEREEEREIMRKEVQRLREHVHSLMAGNVTQRIVSGSDPETDVFQSAGDLTNIEEDP